MRIIARRCSWILAIAALGVPAAAVADAVVARDSVEKYVNIRVAPNASSEVIGKLHRGKPVEHVSSMPRWHAVISADGRKGFVSSVWTKIVEVPSTAITEEVEPVVEATPVEAVVAAKAAEPAPELVVQNAISTDGESEVINGVPVDIDPSGEPAVADSTVDTGEVAPVPKQMPTGLSVSADQQLLADEPVVPPPTRPLDIVPSEPPMAEEPVQAPALEGMTGTPDYLVKFTEPTKAGNSRIIDDGTHVGIGTAEPQQALDVNGNVQIHNQSSNLVVLSLRQASGKTGYITHNIAGTLTLGAGSEDRITVDRNGNVGIGTNRPRHQLEMASGAYVTAGGVWTNASSRDLKENIAELALEEALVALRDLKPVQFNYKQHGNDRHAGFIAEDVPDLVASMDRRGLSAMDIVAVLTTIVQDQQRRLDELEARFPND